MLLSRSAHGKQFRSCLRDLCLDISSVLPLVNIMANYRLWLWLLFASARQCNAFLLRDLLCCPNGFESPRGDELSSRTIPPWSMPSRDVPTRVSSLVLLRTGDGGGSLLHVARPKVQALRQCLEHTMPAISREEAFFCTLFGLNPAKDPGAREAAHRWVGG